MTPLTSANRRFVLAAVLASAVVVDGCAHRSTGPAIAALQTGSPDEVGPRLSNYSQATVPQHGSIVVRSDDFVGRPSPAPSRKTTKPVATISLADALAQATGLLVVDQSRPFETLDTAAKRLKDAEVGNLLIISYGFGDAAALSKTDFRASLIAMIDTAHKKGAAVYLVVEPASTTTLSVAAETYRNTFRAVAASEGAGLIDAPAILLKAGWGPSRTAIQPKPAVEIIAGSVAAYIKVAPKTGP